MMMACGSSSSLDFDVHHQALIRHQHPYLHHPPWHIKDEVLPQILSHDKFDEWPTGYVQRAYSASCADARGHQSGWAMRNTNNHDPKRLKKSCLGVMTCSRKCVNDEGFVVHIRPFICDKARRRQEGGACPTKGCEGHLVQTKCGGNGGKPVTHIWRSEGNTVFFQARGEHGHPAPEPKMSSVTARRLADSRKRPCNNTGYPHTKNRNSRKGRPPHVLTTPHVTKIPREMMMMFDGLCSPQLAFDCPPPENIPEAAMTLQGRGSTTSPPSGHLQMTSSTAIFNPSSGTQFIPLNDFPQPQFPPQTLCPDHHEIAPFGGACPSPHPYRGAYLPLDELYATMVNPGVGMSELLHDFKDIAMVTHPSTSSSGFFLPPVQPSYPCDQGYVLAGEGYYRCTQGVMTSEEGANPGLPSFQGAVMGGPSENFFSDGFSRGLHSARWISPHHASPVHRSPTSIISQYPQSQYQSQNHGRGFKVVNNISSSNNSIPRSPVYNSSSSASSEHLLSLQPTATPTPITVSAATRLYDDDYIQSATTV